MLQSWKRWRWPAVAIGLALVAMVAFIACAEEAEERSVTLEPIGDSGVTGRAILSSTDGGTEIVVTVDGGLTEGSHANHLHFHISCDDLGNIDVTLEELQASADGDATATTTIADRSPSDFQKNYDLVVHAGSGVPPGAPLACGLVE